MYVSPCFPLDTSADSYVQSGGRSEKFIGDNDLASEFRIITKAPMCLVPGGSTKEGILQQWEESAEALKIERVRQSLSYCSTD
jgi:aflatoxin B1 aldehyde reductase